MDPACLQFRLTDAERRSFLDNGYLIVHNALDRAATDRLIRAVDCVDARERTPEHGRDRLLSFANILPEDEAFVDLIDCRTTFPKVWGILGWNIYVYHTHLDVTPVVQTPPAKPVAWHQDSMRVNEEIESHPRPRLSLKIGYFLTDVTQPTAGGTLLVPASHLRDELDCADDGVANPPGAIPLQAPPGSALILDRRLWHSRNTNLGPHMRKVIWIGYAYRWLRAKDALSVQHLWERVDPVRRQLLGYFRNANSAYDPEPVDVPLRGWLEEHCPTDARSSTHHATEQARPPLYGIRGKNTGRV